jgi:hypothetical protein
MSSGEVSHRKGRAIGFGTAGQVRVPSAFDETSMTLDSNKVFIL